MQFDQEFLNSLSTRARNVCLDNKFYNRNELRNYIQSGKDLNRLRRCGRKTVLELIGAITEIPKQTEPNASSDWYGANQNFNHRTELIDENNILSVKKVLQDEIKKQYLIESIAPIFNKQSLRTKNALISICGSNEINIFTFIQKAVLNHIQFGKIRSVGSKTIKELNNLKYEVIERCKKIDSIDLDETTLMLFELERCLGLDLSGEELLKSSLETNSVNLIWFFDRYILQAKLFNDIEQDILLKYYCSETASIYGGNNKLIGIKHSLSRERVRQIESKLLKTQLPVRLGFLRKLLGYSYDLNTLVADSNYWKVSLQPSPFSMELEYLQNDLPTLTKVIGSIISDDSYIISSEDELSMVYNPYDREFYTKHRKLNIHYLIKKSFIEKGTLINYLTEVYHRKVMKIESDFLFVPSYWTEKSLQLKTFVGKLILENFHIESKYNGVLLQRNTLKKIPEMIIEILTKNDAPMTVDEIFDHVNLLYPGRCKSEGGIRGALQRDEFIYFRASGGNKFGRGSGVSTYGLKEWEDTKGLKAGSIKQLCYEYLCKKSRPVHALELTRHITQFRNTSQKSIIHNLQIDPHNKFTFFKGGFMGVTGIDYDKGLISKFSNMNARQHWAISMFVKNHLFYNYSELVNKFSKLLDLSKIQIENSIMTRCEEGIFRLKDERIYYNSIEEDAILKKLFKNEDFITSGFNPYRCELDDRRVLAKVGLSKSAQYCLDESVFEFNSYDLEHSKLRLFILYYPPLRAYKAVLWLSWAPKELIKHQISFDVFESYSMTSINETTHVISFSAENSGKFLAALKVLMTTNYKVRKLSIGETEVDLRLFDLTNKTKFESYSVIIHVIKEKYNIDLQLTEAKKIYNRLILRNT